MINITRLNHTAINTPGDAGALQDFYRDHLNVQFAKRDIPEEFAALVPGFWMQFSNGQVHVIEHDAQGQAGAMNPMGPHVAFYVEDLQAAREYIEAQGIASTAVEDIVFIQDPAGNTLEFQQDPDCV